jgi:hypothetical protein
MDKKLKITLKKALDRLLQKTLEEHYRHTVRSTLQDNIKSPKDFLLGIIVGDMMEGLGFCTFGAYKRYPKTKEFNELLKIIQTRSEEIKTRITQILNQQSPHITSISTIS